MSGPGETTNNGATAPHGDAPLRPAGLCHGPGHIVVYGNPALLARFGGACVGVPAREGLLQMPRAAFALLDSVLTRGKPLARWVPIGGEDWRMTAAPLVDIGTGEIYGVRFHLRARSDAPIRSAEMPSRE